MKLASTWTLTAAGAAVVAFVGTRPLPLRSPQIGVGTVEVADVASGGDAAPAFPPQPQGDQVKYLQQLVDELHQENEQLGTLDHQVLDLRRDMADRQAERHADAADQAAQQAAFLQTLDRLRRDEDALSYGDTDGVDQDLAAAEASLWGGALFEIQAAREALAREDLYPARQHIAAALAEGQVLQ
jgi:hypothetical protein